MKRILLFLVIVCVCAGAAFAGWKWWSQRDQPKAMNYRTAPAAIADIVSTIGATGTIVPEDVVDVGAQINGPIASFGKDVEGNEVDYRSQVDEGMVLAKIDDVIYAAQVASDEASLAQANAQEQLAQASRQTAMAKLDQAERDWERAQKLTETKALAQADFDAAKSNFEQSQAGVAQADASIASARASIQIAQAALMRSRRNLFYCTITSPVKGVIIDRKVQIGQTVVSSLNAPSLFLIAKDLARMQVLVQVNEADIGHVQPGEPVTFSVDAFPGETFAGTVRKVRLNATMTQNVVTYTVEIASDNSNQRLLPYLTANVQFIVDKREQVLAVPNAALRFTPTAAGTDASGAGSGAGGASRPGGPNDAGRKKNTQGAGNAKPGSVWVLDATTGVPRRIEVRVGLSDGNVTEIMTDAIKDGDEVITSEAAPSGSSRGAAAQSTNPFAPSFGRGRR